MNLSFLIILLPVIIGFAIGFFTKPDKWFRTLKRPLLNPPPYVFSIAWFILYILIGVSYYLALKDKSLKYWIIPIIHLIINFSYTPIMFIYKQLFESAFIVLLTLITLIIVMILFYSYKKYISVYLLIPYLLWLMFANYLAWSFYFLNKKMI
jgi:tryptophan-rich sensory protein